MSADFAGLPFEVLREIFSRADGRTVALCARVCRRWRAAAGDEWLWARLGERAECACKRLCSCGGAGGASCASPGKRRFLRVMPDTGVAQGALCERAGGGVLERLRVLWRPWNVVMFGCGLEVAGSGLVSRMMWGGDSAFKAHGMLAGRSGGVGGGVRLSFRSSRVFNLVALYRNNKTARELRDAGGRPLVLHNHLIDGATALAATREVCGGADAFVYVYDASEPLSEASVRDFALLVAPGRAVLVLHVVGDGARTCVTLPALRDALGLEAFESRWCMLSVDAASFGSLERGFDWLLPGSVF